jgi:hypothetical protein
METMEKTKPRQTIIGQIYETYNYELFKTLDGNRDTTKSHIAKLVESMEEIYLLSPIIVNKDMAIIDGQHRYEAAKVLGLPIRYIVDKNADLRAVQLLNAKSKDWTPNDYMDSYIKLGYEEYKSYKKFKIDTGFTHNVCQELLSGGKSSRARTMFKTGEFQVKSLLIGYAVYDVIKECERLYDGANRRSFIYAIHTLLKNKNFKPKVFIKKLSAQRAKMYDCAKTSQYIDLIEEIYNYRNKNKVNLRI